MSRSDRVAAPASSRCARALAWRPSQITDGATLWPLAILFGLNAVDELDRSAFAVLTPEIRDYFHMSNEGIFAVISIVGIAALLGQVVIGYYADRSSRVRLAVVGAAIWGLFTLFTGFAWSIAWFVVARSLTSVGKAVNDPTHRSLLVDYYPPETRTKVYGAHGAANSVGNIIGPLLGGGLAALFGTWRAPFLFLWIPTAVFVVLALLRLPDPVRGAHERRAMGANDDVVATEETPPSMAEAWRICYQVRTLRRIWYSLPFLAASLFGLGSLYSIFYNDVFGLSEVQRGALATVTEPVQLVGLIIGIPLASRLASKSPGLLLKFLAVVGVIVAVAITAFAYTPTLWMAITMNMVIAAPFALLTPGIISALAMVLPPRARSLGFSIGALYTLPGFFVLPIIGVLADSWGIRPALLVLVPIFLIGAFVIASAGSFVASDINNIRSSTLARSEVKLARERGEVKLVLVKDLDVCYDTVQVLFGVNFEVDEGEIVALLGTNGAGKSTLLKAISGVVEASAGAIIFDGVDMTYGAPHEIAARGVVQVPGDRGAFPTLTVEDNLRIAGWLYRRDAEHVNEATQRVLEYFPVLRTRWKTASGNLSGGEQQMLKLGMAFIAKPKLLMIDELSLGLAPAIVEQLLSIVRAIQEQGATVIIVEQSVNVALTIAETAYFMEKGEIRFHGSTEELLGRPDIMRAVFLEGAASVASGGIGKASSNGRRKRAKANGNGSRRMGPPVLEVHELRKSFGGVNAVNGVDLTLRENEILGVIGPNGAGKTTLLDLISGYLIPDSGQVLFDDYDVTFFAPDVRSRLGLGRSFQDARLVSTLTVAENLALFFERHLELRDPVAAALHLPHVAETEADIDGRVEQLIELMSLHAFRDKFVGELSTGSRRVVDLACALAHSPKVLLLDEPSSGIAQRETEALGPLLLRIREELGASLIVIEHDMPLITSVADEILALDLGAPLTRGRPRDVLRHPKVIQAYLGGTEAVIHRSGARRSKSRLTSAPKARNDRAPAKH